MNFRFIYFFAGFLLLIIAACSTEKNTFVSRTYHGTTARYNGLFNANELLNQSLTTFRKTTKEDYYQILPISQLPNDEEVMGMYPAIDTAISKCTKVISRHSMPTTDMPSKKKVEYNHWIDENWLAIGRSLYYRRDFDGAMKNFEFIRKFFVNDPTNYEATLWIAKTQIQIHDLSGAQINLDLLDVAAEETAAKSRSKGFKGLFKKKEQPTSASGKKLTKAAKKRLKKKNKKNKEKDKAQEKAEFPKKILFEFEKTKAELALARKEYDKASGYLEESLQYAKRNDKARVNYIIAQISEKLGNNEKAKLYYGNVLKYNSSYEMNFNARINRAFVGGDGKIKKQLLKMSKDPKNAEYKDQIYYALADISLQENNQPQAITYLHKSTFYSTNNKRQKGRSYERLGDLSFREKNYVAAQKYYDSCAKSIPENYPNAEAIKNKASKLQKLVVAIETAEYEDSVQRIAQLSPEDQEKFATNVIKKLKEDEDNRKRQEAIKMKELQSQTAVNQDQLTGNKSYWNNSKIRAAGFDDFRKQWGQRDNEDDWRRSDKIVIPPTALVPNNTSSGDPTKTDPGATTEPISSGPSVESLLANIPKSDSAMAISNEKLVEALYDAGMIYKEQLNEPGMATQQFEKILARKADTEYNLMASYQLYKISETTDSQKADIQKDYILTYYPNSDYANYLRDPDFFIKRKERERLNEQDYIRVLDRYNRKLYYPVISKADEVIETEKENPYRSKYMLLKALSMGQMSQDKQGLVPVLDQVIAEYPGTPEEARAKEMLNIIKNGYSANIESDFNKVNIYKEEENDEFWVVIFPDANDQRNLSLVRSNVSDFNKEFFSRNKLTTEAKVLGSDGNIILVKTLNKKDALVYLNKFKKTKKYLGNLMTAKTFFISKENLRTLFETNKVEEYEMFFLENY